MSRLSGTFLREEVYHIFTGAAFTDVDLRTLLVMSKMLGFGDEFEVYVRTHNELNKFGQEEKVSISVINVPNSKQIANFGRHRLEAIYFNRAGQKILADGSIGTVSSQNRG